ncbi:MAG: S8 family serine peptidase, partial [Verrucomicrobiota bacterium]
GSSYATPLAAGLAAFILSVNPALTPAQIIDIMKTSALDLGVAGWDQYFGWGRLDFGKIAEATFATLPISKIAVEPSYTIKAEYVPGAEYQLLRSTNATEWQAVTGYTVETNGTSLFFKDNESPEQQAYYEIQVRLP